MQETFKFGLSVSDAAAYLESAKNNLDLLLNTDLQAITTSLNNNTWQGDSYQRCLEIHALLIEYCSELAPCCEIALTACNDQKANIDNFNNSKIVTDVNSWEPK